MDSGEYLAMGARRENDYMNRPPKKLSNQDPRHETCFTKGSSEEGKTAEKTRDSEVYAEIPDVRYQPFLKPHIDADPRMLPHVDAESAVQVLAGSLPVFPVPRPARSRCKKPPLSWCVLTIVLAIIIAILGAVLVTGRCLFTC